ncbi:MAG: hypothetical protein JXR46_06710 [Calditrichaceae bacterium]|nr:hypothetical protein [Calditrichaceae bacterium]MBN2708720.1 hypothetical protein [Calditrichaceae bacterium]RQV92157.1 MAG: hypothetical protein EH224_16390 [Calditrichota bacterium]
MIALETFFKNHFDTNKISDDNMAKFTLDHIQKLSAANAEGAFSELISETTTAYENYYGAITSEDVKYAIQQSLTKTMNNEFSAFKKAVSQKEGLVRSVFGTMSPEYLEFFPGGVTEYSNATLANCEMLMNRMVASANKYTDRLGQEFTDLFTGIRDRFAAARKAQLTKIGEVKDNKQDASSKRDALERQLMKNLLTLALANIGNENKVTAYYDKSIIK